MYKIFVGHISPERKADWFCKNENPFSVWEGDALVTQICYVDTWTVGDRMLRDRVDVDWGSVAWKGTKQELIRFFRECNFNADALKTLDANTEYAVLFLECVGWDY